MKVLYWTQQFHPYIGGVEVLGASFLPALVARGHEPVVVTSHGALDLPDEDEWRGVAIHRLPFASVLASREAGPVAEALAAVARLKRRLRPDLVHVNVSDPSAWFHLRTIRVWPCPSVVSVRVSVGRAGGANSLLADLLRSADRVTGASAAALADAIAACPEIEDRAVVIPNGLPRPAVEPAPLSVDPLVLVAAGRLVVDKGFDVAVRALAPIRARRPDAVLRIAGDGPERAALEALATSLGVADGVEFLGWVEPSEIAALLADASVVVMPSRWQEAFGLVALQAAQVGRPVVATRVGGLLDVVTHGVTGLLVENEDDVALAAAVLALADEPRRAERMGAAGRRRATACFDFDRYVEDHVALYTDLLG